VAGVLSAAVPDGLPDGFHPVVVTNPDGCQSQGLVLFEVAPAPRRCGLLGIEGFALLGALGWMRRRARRERA
jgi:hypothetical protein